MGKVANKYYAVRVGRKPGIYETWEECREQTHGYPGAVFKGFPDLESAKAFRDGRKARYVQPDQQMSLFDNDDFNKANDWDDGQAALFEQGYVKSTKLEENIKMVEWGEYEVFDRPDDLRKGIAYVDGSYDYGVYGFGGFVIGNDDKIHAFSGYGLDGKMAAMRNVSGEILGAMQAVRMGLELGLKRINIHYDYAGIEAWAIGEWKTKTAGTMEYVSFMREKAKDIQIRFQKVKGHTNVWGNELADKLAGEAVMKGIKELRGLNSTRSEGDAKLKEYWDTKRNFINMSRSPVDEEKIRSISEKMSQAEDELDELFGR